MNYNIELCVYSLSVNVVAKVNISKTPVLTDQTKIELFEYRYLSLNLNYLSYIV